ncbi:hypothetical protein K1X76_10080 [bacterium]|nr:hypothetical protein [bacterium]
MKKIILCLLSVCLTTSPVFAGIQAQCTNFKGKTSPCTIDNQAGNLVVTYKSAANASLNKNIPGKNITGLSGGEYARRRVAESVTTAILIAPVALFMLFSKKKIDNYGVEYIDKDKKPASFLIQCKKKYSMTLQSLLQSISGKQVIFQETGKK